MAEKKSRVSVLTEVVYDDASAAELAQRVEEIVEDHPGAKVLWFQSAVSEAEVDVLPVRLTAVISWRYT